MRRVLLILIAAWISGCHTSTEDLFPQDGPTMLDVYNDHVTLSGVGSPGAGQQLAQRAGANAGANDAGSAASYTRTAENEIDSLFPTLENPNLVMYVFPHLTSGERLPVPGYSTSFPLFERTEFALPGETKPKAPEKPKQRIRIVSGDSPSTSIRTH